MATTTISTPAGELTHEQIRDAYRTMIWRECRDLFTGIADDLVSEIKSGEIKDYDALQDAMHERCDGSLVYTADCEEYLQASESDGAMEDETGEIGSVEARAFFALRADVAGEMDDRGFGFDGDGWNKDESADE